MDRRRHTFIYIKALCFIAGIWCLAVLPGGMMRDGKALAVESGPPLRSQNDGSWTSRSLCRELLRACVTHCNKADEQGEEGKRHCLSDCVAKEHSCLDRSIDPL